MFFLHVVLQNNFKTNHKSHEINLKWCSLPICTPLKDKVGHLERFREYFQFLCEETIWMRSITGQSSISWIIGEILSTFNIFRWPVIWLNCIVLRPGSILTCLRECPNVMFSILSEILRLRMVGFTDTLLISGSMRILLNFDPTSILSISGMRVTSPQLGEIFKQSSLYSNWIRHFCDMVTDVAEMSPTRAFFVVLTKLMLFTLTLTFTWSIWGSMTRFETPSLEWIVHDSWFPFSELLRTTCITSY